MEAGPVVGKKFRPETPPLSGLPSMNPFECREDYPTAAEQSRAGSIKPKKKKKKKKTEKYNVE